MRYRNLGQSGLVVSAIGLGCNNLGGRIDQGQSNTLVHAALDQGITLFDVADVYGRRDAHVGASEEALRRALIGKRSQAIIATKFGMKMGSGDDPSARHSGASRHYILKAVDASLKRLGTDWIDLYQLHCPDPLTPLEETLHTLDGLITAGKIRYAGVSNLPAWQVADACHIARRDRLAGIISCQDELSLLSRSAEKELLPALQHFGLGLLPYFPLASGMLTGKYRKDASPPEGSRLAAWTYLQERYRDPAIWSLIEALEELAAHHERPLADLAFGWLLRNPVIGSVIAGATSVAQLDANIRSCEAPLDDRVLDALDALLEKHGAPS